MTDFYESCHVHSCNHQLLWAFCRTDRISYTHHRLVLHLHNEQMQWLAGNFEPTFYTFSCSIAFIMYKHWISDFVTWNLIFTEEKKKLIAVKIRRTRPTSIMVFSIIIYVQEAHFSVVFSTLEVISKAWTSFNMWIRNFQVFIFSIVPLPAAATTIIENVQKFHWFAVWQLPFHWKGANEMLTHKSWPMKMAKMTQDVIV